MVLHIKKSQIANKICLQFICVGFAAGAFCFMTSNTDDVFSLSVYSLYKIPPN